MAITEQCIGVLVLAALMLARKQVDAATCHSTTGSTLVCDDSCNEVGMCSGNYQWTSYENCQRSSKVCREGACVPYEGNEDYCNNLYKYTCPSVTEETRYPSLIDCTSYYVCTPAEQEVPPSQCGGGAWNACTRDCSGSLINGECPTSSTSCTKTGEIGIAPGYDRQWYICTMNTDGNIQPVWSTCSEGQRFSLTSRRCEDVGTTSACTVCGNATRVPGSMPSYRDTCSFLYCHSRTNFEVVTCRQGWHYDHSQGGCIHGAC